MVCCRRHSEKRIAVTLSFMREQLLYDLAQLGYVEGDIMPEDTQDSRHQTQDIAEDGNVDRVTRVLDLCNAEMTDKLYPYTKAVAVDGTQLDDVMTEPERYDIVMSLTDETSQTSVKLLELLIHEYYVCSVMADWLSITKPEGAQRWAEKATTALAKIQSALTRHMRPRRLRLHEF